MCDVSRPSAPPIGGSPLAVHEAILVEHWKEGGNARGSRAACASSLAFYRLSTARDEISSDFGMGSCYASVVTIEQSLANYEQRIVMKNIFGTKRGGGGRSGKAGDAAVKILAIKAGLKKIDVFVDEIEGFSASLQELRKDADNVTKLAFEQLDAMDWTW